MNKKMRLLGDSKTEVLEITLKEDEIGLVFFLNPAATQLYPSARLGIFAIPKSVAQWAPLPILELLATVKIKKEDVISIRLIGSNSTIAAAKKDVDALGIETGKPIPFEKAPMFFQFLPVEGRIRISAAPSLAPPPAKVLIVDDSETIRKLLQKIISQDPGLECVGTIADPREVEDAIKKLSPDVLTLDIHMPEINGAELVKRLFPKYRLPMVMISSLSMEDGTDVLTALEAGAVDYIQKPSAQEIKNVAPLICEKVKNAASLKSRLAVAKPKATLHSIPSGPGTMSDVDMSFLIAIGSSTGGTEALRDVLTSLPEKIPPIVIVQHIPALFSKAFADRMNKLCKFEVKEAEQDDLVTPNRVFIAPGGKQMSLKDHRGELRIEIDDSPPVNRHKPSVDYLFDSIAEMKLTKVAAAILTGMGNDGARGLLKLKKLGARTLAQDEATSIVFGMPREAIQMGGVEKVVPLQEVGFNLLQFCQKKSKGQ